MVNGGIADVMTVFAKTDVTDLNNEVTQKVWTFARHAARWRS